MRLDADLQILRPRVFDSASLVAGFTTRKGGFSRGPFQGLNLGYSSGDDRETVARNRRLLTGAIGTVPARIAMAHQVHGARVVHVTEPGEHPGYDGLVTTQPEICLCIVAADCAAVLMADAGRRVIGACHAGWRGTVAGIVPNTLEAMEAAGARPEHIRAYVSPSISVNRFEVGPEVAERFHPRYVRPGPQESKHFVDLKSAVRDQLIAGGLTGEQVEVSDLCTYERTDLFFSYRAEKGRTGRMMGFIMQTYSQ